MVSPPGVRPVSLPAPMMVVKAAEVVSLYVPASSGARPMRRV